MPRPPDFSAGLEHPSSQNVGAYFPKTSCIAPQTSPIEQRSFSAWRMNGTRLSLPRAALAQLLEALLDERLVAVGLERRQPLDLLALGLGVDAQQVGDLELVLDVLVDAHDDVLADAIALLVAPGALVDLAGDEAGSR